MNNIPLDMVKLIEKSPITRLSKDYQDKLLTKIQNTFTNYQQQLFVSSFYCYLNYNSKNEFVIDLDDIWKWVGFERKDCGKRILKHFVINIDYIIISATTGEANPPIITAPQFGGANKESGVQSNRGGKNKEQILMTINCFKKFCLKASTKKADEIHEYYIKLEELVQDLLNEESNELRVQLKKLENKVEILQNKPEVEGFSNNEGYIYLIKDVSIFGAYKIGMGANPNTRISTLNVASCQKTLKIAMIFKTWDMKGAEKIIHSILNPFKVKKRNEWFYFSSDLQLNYAINTIKSIVSYIDRFNFENYNEFKKYAEKIYLEIDELQHIQKDDEDEPEAPITNIFHKKNDKISMYIGVSYCIKSNEWMCRIQKNKETLYLGTYKTDIEAAKAYNDYAIFTQQTDVNIKYILNDIENYIPNPRDIIKENKKTKLLNKSSNYNCVYWVKSKQIFHSSIQYKKKKYELIKNDDETECAKIYNEQALYMNNHLGTNYKLNDLQNFVTIEKNHVLYFENAKSKKFSRFVGVSIRKDSGSFRAYIKHERKRIDCGTFKTEIQAAKAYNDKAQELNDTFGEKYELNNLDN